MWGRVLFTKLSCNRMAQPSAARRFATSEANLITAFTGLGSDVHVHMEAGELAAWVRSVIAPLVKRVVISHPRTNAWIANDPPQG